MLLRGLFALVFFCVFAVANLANALKMITLSVIPALILQYIAVKILYWKKKD